MALAYLVAYEPSDSSGAPSSAMKARRRSAALKPSRCDSGTKASLSNYRVETSDGTANRGLIPLRH